MQDRHKNIALGRTIVVLRTTKKLTSAGLATQASIHPDRLTDIERGTTLVDEEELPRLAAALALDTDELMNLAEGLMRTWRA